MVTRHAWITSLSVLVACADPPISFFDEPRPCELLGEVCPPAIPTQLELVDFDPDGRDEFVILGLEGELVVGNPEDGEVLASARVEVEWGTTLSRCSSADLVFQHTLEQWWLWELTDARIEAADHGVLTGSYACFDLGAGADTIVEVDADLLRVDGVEVGLGLVPPGESLRGLALRPEDESGQRFSLFGFALDENVRMARVDLEAVEVTAAQLWPWGPTRIEVLAVAGRDLVVGGPITLDSGELAIVREIDLASAPATWQVERVSLPWWPQQLVLAQLDDDPEPELLVAPLPISALAIIGVGDSASVQMLELEFEGVDLAAGDVDADGLDEIFAIDPREDRILEVEL